MHARHAPTVQDQPALALPTLTRTQRQVFSAVYSQPAQSLNGLARVTGLACGTVSKAVARLETLALLTSERVDAVRVGVHNRHTRTCRLVSPAPWTAA
ncbi:MarR family winged helix-turn-helix transcriptional regulator [Deinococcus sp. HMF7604]|uniref:MarR family transcriptional regulator n=1 Tax=Deinococcus betulae TaxID=2873312 RepID=UPI001CCB7EDF|nr:helix-turn-helix domain-containing protein [Deinococcus betulae]MBZ9752751.1 MarR family winged helix-turn-helix transcriptional regulator [Deinococcus betulae]